MEIDLQPEMITISYMSPFGNIGIIIRPGRPDDKEIRYLFNTPFGVKEGKISKKDISPFIKRLNDWTNLEKITA